MKKEISAGIIIYKGDNKKNRQYLLLLYPRGHWDLAKGKIEKDESIIETAVRETKEETNLDAELNEEFRELLSYRFKGYKGEIVDKTVIYFLGRAKNTNVILSEEHLNYKWLPYQEAIETLTFENAKNIITKAEDFLLIENNN